MDGEFREEMGMGKIQYQLHLSSYQESFEKSLIEITELIKQLNKHEAETGEYIERHISFKIQKGDFDVPNIYLEIETDNGDDSEIKSVSMPIGYGSNEWAMFAEIVALIDKFMRVEDK